MTWRIDDPQGDEAGKVKFEIAQYTRGVVLDFGCGPAKAFPHFIGVDSCKDTELFNIAIRPDVQCDIADPAAIEATFHKESADAIFSSHALEHIENYHGALASWWSLLKVGGHLVLYLPHRDLYPNIGSHGANPDHKHDFTANDILHAMVDMHFDVLVNETRDADCEYSFLLVLKKLAQPFEGLFSYLAPKPEKTVCVCRFGGFGDMIQTAAILPALKREGFHVTVMTTPKGQDILKHDPHVDAWLIQDEDQVPNAWLSDYWRVQSGRFDRFVNLSESIEGTLLSIPGRANHTWPEATRRRLMGVNYNEWTAELAGVDFAPDGKFYPSIDEAAQCQRYLAHVKDRVASAPRPQSRNTAQQIMGLAPSFRTAPLVQPVFNVMWCLAGSSVHKFYPHMDAVIARMLLDWPEAAIHLVGDEACQILEAGWENEPRVFRQSGEMNIRQTMTLAQACDLVIGPETGVLNAVAFDGNAKVVLLSHSSFENLPKHWINAIGIEPNREVAPCFPCHRLHYDRTYCPEHKETGASMCSVSIMPGSVFEAASVAYRRWKGVIPITPVLESA
jgi:ADP-heptose:LPS heptosyltransferase/predicted SAM-dependent methyltransferase